MHDAIAVINEEELRDFQEITSTLMANINTIAEDTECKKLRTIGLRMKLDNMQRDTQRATSILQSRIEEKEQELDRYQTQLESLLRADAYQRNEIIKLKYGN